MTHKTSFDPRFELPTKKESLTLRTIGRSSTESTGINSILSSNLWDLEVKELLKECTVDYRRIVWLETRLREIREVLTAAARSPSDISFDGPEAASLSRASKGHYIPHEGNELKIRFKQPSKVSVVGSFLLRSIAKPLINVDLAVYMPRDCFAEKDMRDHRYTDLRNLYLVGIASVLRHKEGKIFNSMWMEGFNGDVRRPVLCLGLSKRKRTSDSFFDDTVVVRLLPALDPQSSPFLVRRMRLESLKNNVRRRVVGRLDREQPATPHYTNDVLVDMSFESNLHVLHKLSTTSSAFSLASVLLKVWLRQRKLDESTDSASGFMISMLLVHLLEQRYLNAQMSVFHIFRVCMTWLRDNDLAKTPIQMRGDKDDELLDEKSMRNLQDAFDVVVLAPPFRVIDPDGTTVESLRVNVFSSMSRYAANVLRHQAGRAVEVFTSDLDPLIGFRRLFVDRMDVSLRSDVLFWIDAPPRPPTPPDEKELDEDDDGSVAFRKKRRRLQNAIARSIRTHNIICDVGWRRCYRDALCDVIEKGLASRARRVHVLDRSRGVSLRWSPFGKRDEHLDTAMGRRFRLLLSVELDPEFAWEVVDKGPSAENKIASAAFRSLWGKKAELRRFNDGTMLESVVWTCGAGDPLDWAHRIPSNIVEHLVRRHFPTSSISRGVANGLEKWQSPSIRSSTTRLLRAFANVERAMKSLSRDALPLHVTTVRPSGSSFRFDTWSDKSVQSPHPLLMSSSSGDDESVESLDVPPRPVDIVVTLESSAQWPDNVEAIRRTKTAFLLRLRDALKTEHSIMSFVSCTQPQSWLDVCSDGFVFRATISQDREWHLLHKCGRIAELRQVKQRERHLPHATALIRAVGDQHRCFPETVSLVLRWFATHGLLSSHVDDVLVELIVASVFTHSSGDAEVPQSVCAGFLRVLDVLAHHDWENVPLVVDPQRHLRARDRRLVRDAFERHREVDGKDVYPMFVVCAPPNEQIKSWGVVAPKRGGDLIFNGEPADTASQQHRRIFPEFAEPNRPSKPVVDRLTRLARLSLTHLQSMIDTYASEERTNLLVSAVFVPASTQQYDIVLLLRPRRDVLADAEGPSPPKRRRKRVQEFGFRNLRDNARAHAAKECQRFAGFDPHAQFARAVQERMDGIGICFWDVRTIDRIGIVLKPSWLKSSAFKLMSSATRMPHNDGHTTPNVRELCGDLRRMGRGLVSSVISHHKTEGR